MLYLIFGIGFMFTTFFTAPLWAAGENSVSWPREANDLPSLIDEALEHNPELLSAQAKKNAARARIPQAWALENPSFSYDVMGEDLQTRVGPQEKRYGVMQEIPFPFKLPLRKNAARLEWERVDHELLHMRQAVRSEVISAYADLMSAQQTMAVLEEQRTVLEQISAAMAARYATGDQQSADIARIEAELAKTTNRILATTDQRVAAQERLNILLNRSVSGHWPMLAVPPVPEVSQDIDTLKQMTLENRHGLIVKRLMLQEQEVRTKLAKMEYMPDFEIGFDYVEIGGGTTTDADDGQDAWMIPIKVNLPIWNHQIRGQINEAKALKESAAQDVQNATNRAVADVVQGRTQFATSRDRLLVYEKTFIPQAEQAFQGTLAGYQAGNFSLVEVLDNRSMLLEARIGYWESYADTWRAYGAVEQAVGIPLTDVALKESVKGIGSQQEIPSRGRVK